MFTLWLTIFMVVIFIFCSMDCFHGGVSCSGLTSPTSSEFDDYGSPSEPKSMSQLCGQIYCVRFVGHITSEE